MRCAVADEVRFAAREIIRRSRIQEGALGLRDVALSPPAVVDVAGTVEVIEPELDESERAALARSADVLRRARGSLDAVA